MKDPRPGSCVPRRPRSLIGDTGCHGLHHRGGAEGAGCALVPLMAVREEEQEAKGHEVHGHGGACCARTSMMVPSGSRMCPA
jgi:hypothetical protein